MYPAHILTDTPWLVALLLAFLLGDVMAFRPDGFLMLQVGWLRNTRSARTFGRLSGAYALAAPLMLLQLFVSEGLGFFCALRSDAALALSDLQPDAALMLALCVAAPAVWFVVQWGLFRWSAFLMGETERLIIFNRAYLAIHLLAAPLALLLLLISVLVPVGPTTAAVLFNGLFILQLIAFVFCGIKIFCDGILSLCFIFLYLCTLEIAPLAVLIAKLT